MALGLQAIQNRLACQAFFRVMEENLKFNTASIQDMKRGRLPLVPSLDPKDTLNISCNSMLVLATSLRNQFLFHPVYFTDWTSSVVALMPAISFWLCLFCEHIILPSRTSEFTFIDFHRAVVFILAWAVRQNKIMMEPKLFTDYLPFLWFHLTLPLAVRNMILMTYGHYSLPQIIGSWHPTSRRDICLLVDLRKTLHSPLASLSNSSWMSLLISGGIRRDISLSIFFGCYVLHSPLCL